MRVGIFDHMDCAHSVKALDGCDVTHGHTYKVEVVVAGELKDGLVIDFKALRETARRAMSKYDHKDLSLLFEVPSCENLCIALFNDIRKELPGLRTVRCWEGYNKWAEANAEDLA
jgi:6-pyruvoyltetrahydropterin/6-carboxytetrahydropterin synthase